MEEYIEHLQQKNYVCEVKMYGRLVTVLYLSKKYATPEVAKSEFRTEALRIKEQEEGEPIRLVMHL